MNDQIGIITEQFSDKLLPCPFCGNTVIDILIRNGFYARCSGCGSICGVDSKTPSDCARIWNKRTYPHALKCCNNCVDKGSMTYDNGCYPECGLEVYAACRPDDGEYNIWRPSVSDKYLWRVIIAALCIVGCADEYYSLSTLGDKYECNHIIEKQATTRYETLAICNTAAECKVVCDTERAKARGAER